MAGLPSPVERLHANDGVELPYTNGDGIAEAPPTAGLNVDVLIVGGGFGGIYGLHGLRKLGLSVKLFEAGSDFGGTWHWNRYPGARVDSESPFYGLSIPEVYSTWTWTERFAGHEEIRSYFQHVDNVLHLRQDTFFDTVVTEATFDCKSGRWKVTVDNGRSTTAKYLVLATGSSYKQHIPDLKGLDKYAGQVLHSAAFPERGVDFSGKKVGVVGNGATGVQLVQELARQDCELTTFIRTPNIALPMQQRQLSDKEQTQNKSFYDHLFTSAKGSRSGYPYNAAPKRFYESTLDERTAHWERIWRQGGFSFLISNYPEYVFDKEVNNAIYSFWAAKVRARIRDESKRTIVAPLQQPHWFGTKRPSLEQNYYEQLDRSNVTVVDLKRTPIKELEAKGIRTVDKLHELDIIILATGYDALTGSLTNLGLHDTDGVSLAQRWEKGVSTYLGLTIPKFPNLFMSYSPQAPTALANGPTIIEIQIDWIIAAIRKIRDEGIKYIDAKQSSAVKWKEDIQADHAKTLFRETDSWYTGANIPGKKREQLLYLRGVDEYSRVTKSVLEQTSWEGFDVVKSD